MSLFFPTRPLHQARTRHRLRPRLDALEDRSLLTAGALDPTFGTGGLVLTGFPSVKEGAQGTEGEGIAVQIQPDGKIVAAGWGYADFAVARYNTNGSLDSTFGSGGEVVTTFTQQLAAFANGLAIQPDGKIVVVGYTLVNSKNSSYTDFAVARYNSNGTLDTTFGPNDNGLVTTEILGSDQADAVVIQPDGKILVAGSAAKVGSSTGSPALVRYNSNGTLDTTFGQGGIMTPTLPGAPVAFASLALETVNGATEFVVEGGSTSGPVLARYNLNGSLDTTFGSGGSEILPKQTTGLYAGSLVIEPNGQIVLTGDSENPQGQDEGAIARFDVNGSLDPTFNPDGPTPGVAVIPATVGGAFYHGAIQPDGKIVAVGAVYTSTGREILLTRLNTDGSLDSTFGTNGVVLDSLTGGATARAVALQSNGEIVTVGEASSTTGPTDDVFAIARFLNQAPTTTTLASSANPSVSGQSVTFTATVSTAGANSPTGTVQFFDGSTLLGTGTLGTANGVTTATFTTTTLAVGTDPITAVYGGDGNDMGSTSAVLSQVVDAASTSDVRVGAAPAVMPAPSSPGSFIVPLGPMDFDFLTSPVGGKRRRSS